MNTEHEPSASVRLIERARLASGTSVRTAARRAGISEGRWRQIAKGYQQVTKEVRAPVRAPVETVARMALAVGLTPDAFESEPEVAASMRSASPLPSAPGPEDPAGSERLEWFEFAHATSQLASDTVLHLERGDVTSALENAREVALRLTLMTVGAGSMRPKQGFAATLEQLRARTATRLDFVRFTNDPEEHGHAATTNQAGESPAYEPVSEPQAESGPTELETGPSEPYEPEQPDRVQPARTRRRNPGSR